MRARVEAGVIGLVVGAVVALVTILGGVDFVNGYFWRGVLWVAVGAMLVGLILEAVNAHNQMLDGRLSDRESRTDYRDAQHGEDV